MAKRQIRTRTSGRSKGKRYPLAPGIPGVQAMVAEVEVVKVKDSKLKAWNVKGQLQDGRKIAFRVQARNQSEAGELVRNKFPLVIISSIKRPSLIRKGLVGLTERLRTEAGL